MLTDLEKSIIKTLAYFDIFNYPLTISEIWKYLYCPHQSYTLLQVKEVLEQSQFLQSHLVAVEGFYAIRGREHTYLLRKQNNNWADRKLAKAARLARVYRFLPFIKMIAVCNSLAYSNARHDSDIDLFIVASRGKIWLARFWAVFWVRLFNLRPNEQKRRDTFCFSFFIDEAHLDISNVRLGQHDIYLAYWVQQLLPIYDTGGLYAKLLVANSWYKKCLPNSYPNQFVNEVKANKFSQIFSRALAVLFDPPVLGKLLRPLYRRVQVSIIDRNMQAMVNIDTKIIVNDFMLKFHANDRRDFFYHRWRENIRQLINPME